MQRNPGHTEFVDKTGENQSGVSYELEAKEADDEELKKALALSMGKNPADATGDYKSPEAL